VLQGQTQNCYWPRARTKLDDITFRWDNSLRLHTTNQMEFGLQATRNEVIYSYDVEELMADEEGDGNLAAPLSFMSILNREDKGTQYSGYIQDRWTILGHFTLTPGLRYTGWIGYTLSKVEYTFPDLEDDPFPALHRADRSGGRGDTGRPTCY